LFLGEYCHNLDKESRLALPARLREAAGERLAAGLCLIRGAERCILAYPCDRLRELVDAVQAEPSISKAAAREFKRALGSRAAVVVPDRQGRILVPDFLRSHAGIDKSVTIVGAVDVIELWDTATFQARDAVREAAYERMASRILG
jgi:MraZ protein